MALKSSTTATQKNGSTQGGVVWAGIATLESTPIGKGVAELALYNEIWSKIRWALGGSFGVEYGKRSAWAGELSRRLALLVLANRPDKEKSLQL